MSLEINEYRGDNVKRHRKKFAIHKEYLELRDSAKCAHSLISYVSSQTYRAIYLSI